MAVLSFGLLAAPLFSSLLFANIVVGLPGAPVVARNGAFTRQGCFSDTSPRIFTADRIANDQMTIEACAAYCSTEPFFGLQYGRECYCGITAAPASLQIPDSQCSFPCAGNPAQKCGAGMRLDVYTNDAYVPYAPPVIVGAPYLGCFADGTPRALPERLLSTVDMTIDKCSTHCAGYQYFGIEYGRECFCGDSAPTVPVPESECDKPCAGDPSTKCGAGMRLSVFGPVTIPPPVTTNPQTVAGFNYDGCYTDSTGLRTLDGPRTGGAGTTLQSCATFCAAYTYFGTENGNECFCGNTLQASASKKSETNCQKTCSGNAALICGDASRLSLYKKAPPPPSSTTKTTSSTKYTSSPSPSNDQTAATSTSMYSSTTKPISSKSMTTTTFHPNTTSSTYSPSPSDDETAVTSTTSYSSATKPISSKSMVTTTFHSITTGSTHSPSPSDDETAVTSTSSSSAEPSAVTSYDSTVLSTTTPSTRPSPSTVWYSTVTSKPPKSTSSFETSTFWPPTNSTSLAPETSSSPPAEPSAESSTVTSYDPTVWSTATSSTKPPPSTASYSTVTSTFKPPKSTISFETSTYWPPTESTSVAPETSSSPPAEPSTVTSYDSVVSSTTFTKPSTAHTLTTTWPGPVHSTTSYSEVTWLEPTETTEGPLTLPTGPSYVTSLDPETPYTSTSLSTKKPPPSTFSTVYSTTTAPYPANTTSTAGPAPTPVTPPVNLIEQNPSFESGAWGWQFSGETDYVNTPVRDGSVALVQRFSNVAGSSINFKQVVDVEAGASYAASFWWWQTNPAADCRVFLLVNGVPEFSVVDTRNFGAGTWSEISVSFEATGAATKVEGYAYCGPFGAPEGEEYGNVVYFDEASLVKTS